MNGNNGQHQLHLHLFGTTQVIRDELPLNFTRRHALALLAYLAVTGQPQRREVLATLLTNEASSERASMQLRNALAVLNRSLSDYLTVTRQTVAFNSDAAWVDVRVFEQGLDAAARASDPSQLQTLVDLYRGELLSGFSLRDAPEFEQWLLQERERLGQCLLRALRTLLDRYLQQGQPSAALATAQHLLILDPWHEEAHRQVMTLLARSDQRAAALAHYETYKDRLASELQLTPAAETTALYARLRTNVVSPGHNLISASTPFIGRSAELDTLLRRLAQPTCRLVTLVGLAGVGKTRLALELAQHYAGISSLMPDALFADGIYLVDLTDVMPGPAANGNVAQAITLALVIACAAALGVSLQGQLDPATQLLNTLRPRRLLLLLDNFEHLLGGSAWLVELLRRAPEVKLLVTSRVRLRVQEEWVFQVEGLSIPQDLIGLEQADASRLFLQQSEQNHLAVPFAVADYPHILRICQLTQGLPLALVLAASWLPTLPVAELAQELATSLDLLTTSGQNISTRHRSLRAVLNWSWRRLNPAEQRSLRQLSVFRGSFGRDAARAVAGADVTHLRTLRDNGLLTLTANGRYLLHSLVRQFAAEQLAADATEETQTRARHAAHFAALIAPFAAALCQTRTALNSVTLDLDNLHAAWEWAARWGELDLLEQMRTGLSNWHLEMGLYLEAQEVFAYAITWVRSALGDTRHPGQQKVLAGLLIEQAAHLIKMRQLEPARAALEEAQALLNVTYSLELTAQHAYDSGELMWEAGYVKEAQAHFEHAVQTARRFKARYLEGEALHRSVIMALNQVDAERAQVYHQASLPVYRAVGHQLAEARIQYQMGAIQLLHGDFVPAVNALQHSLHLFRLAEDLPSQLFNLLTLAQVYVDGQGYYREAEEMLRQCLRQPMYSFLQETIHVWLAWTLLAQGDLDAAQVTYQQALDICHTGGYRAGIGRSLNGLGWLALYRGEPYQALQWAAQAFDILHSMQRTYWERFALTLRGAALTTLGEWTRAADAYAAALAIDDALGQGHLAVEARAGLAAVALAQHDLQAAHQHVIAIQGYLRTRVPAGGGEPMRVYLGAYQVLRALDDSQAGAMLSDGYGLLQARAAHIAGEQRQRMFFENIPSHRELLRLYQMLPQVERANATSFV